jgi:hypothetical protein
MIDVKTGQLRNTTAPMMSCLAARLRRARNHTRGAMSAAALQRENQRLALQHHTLARHLRNTWCTVSAGCVQNMQHRHGSSSTCTLSAHGAPYQPDRSTAWVHRCVLHSTRTNMRLRQACMQG